MTPGGTRRTSSLKRAQMIMRIRHNPRERMGGTMRGGNKRRGNDKGGGAGTIRLLTQRAEQLATRYTLLLCSSEMPRVVALREVGPPRLGQIIMKFFQLFRL
jgi:hypothetical protein